MPYAAYTLSLFPCLILCHAVFRAAIDTLMPLIRFSLYAAFAADAAMPPRCCHAIAAIFDAFLHARFRRFRAF